MTITACMIILLGNLVGRFFVIMARLEEEKHHAEK